MELKRTLKTTIFYFQNFSEILRTALENTDSGNLHQGNGETKKMRCTKYYTSKEREEKIIEEPSEV